MELSRFTHVPQTFLSTGHGHGQCKVLGTQLKTRSGLGSPKDSGASPGVGRGDTVRLWNGLICAEKSISTLLV